MLAAVDADGGTISIESDLPARPGSTLDVAVSYSDNDNCVVRSALEIDAGNVAAAGEGLATVTPLVTPDQFREAAVVYLTRAELAERAGIDDEFVGSLVRARLLSPDAMDGFDGDDLAVATTAGKLREFGLDARHMKTVRTAAAREADLVGQAAAPMARSKGDGARQKAEEMAREMTALLVTLHGTLVKRQVNDDLNR